MNEFHHSINHPGETGFVNSGSFSLNGQNSVITDKQFVTVKLKKAAPRFELGVEVLQTSALPLGYAAVTPEI